MYIKFCLIIFNPEKFQFEFKKSSNNPFQLLWTSLVALGILIELLVMENFKELHFIALLSKVYHETLKKYCWLKITDKGFHSL